VRTLQRDNGSIWWVVTDVCTALGVSNPSKACERLTADEKDTLTLSDTVGRPHETLLVNEPGLYRLIMRSRKKAAEAFQHWVFHEVLPQIRMTGAYGQPVVPQVQNPILQTLIDNMIQLDRTEQLARQAEKAARRAEDKADMALAEIRVMTLEDFVLSNGLLRQLPRVQWPIYVAWLKDFCQAYTLVVRKDPVPGRPWEMENVYPITALGALLRHEQTRPRQVDLLRLHEGSLP